MVFILFVLIVHGDDENDDNVNDDSNIDKTPRTLQFCYISCINNS